MLLTSPLLSKSTFFGSLLNKCRQVIKKPQKTPSTTTNNAIKNTNQNNNFTSPTVIPSTNDANLPDTNRPPLLNVANLNANTANSNNISTTQVTLKTIEEKVGLPPRPKRPITPYFRFMRDMRPKLAAENPKLKTQDIIRELSKKWATVDNDVKERLMNEYKRDQETYIQQRLKYDSKITDEQRTEIQQLKQAKQENKERLKMRRRVKDLGRPKRPASAFLRFIINERVSTPQLPKQTYREWQSKCVAKWARLTDAEKEPYILESRAEFEKYGKNLAAWEERMLKLGNVDVIRSGNLIDPPEPKPKKR